MELVTSPTPVVIICVLEQCMRDYETRIIGSALYVNKEWRDVCQQLIDNLRIPRLTRIFICYCGGNTDVVTKTRHILLNQLRLVAGIPNIPDDVSFSMLLDRIPTIFNKDMILASSAIPSMMEHKNTFEFIWGLDKENYSRIYEMMWKNQGDFPVRTINLYDEAMGIIYGINRRITMDPGYPIYVHLSFLVVWYEILHVKSQI